MRRFGAYLESEWRGAPPDLVHSHFWMSGVASLQATRALGLPLAHTYHALGSVKRRHQKDADPSPADRIPWETAVGERCDRIVATCRDEVGELTAMGLDPERITVVPCGVDPRLFTPAGPAAPARPAGPCSPKSDGSYRARGPPSPSPRSPCCRTPNSSSPEGRRPPS
ncbi:hypothetical protein SVIO_017240 [Streptomyces violaceusniger]|uniref:Glycosyltransferase subfamily 4-like N-terminal domain-containing protein n=1 Tax=Streptomyces violaceusniger TaxID=68280 RepID=A0A4D4KP49_STRVO|nr:hypothetical protein SVIO_017240 [Streptomyces violaceusniger]